ncbi:flavodoxin family protein [Maridesulfovibrio ferrireducens]|uniref:flavodoxin family protein n=1 Tax=Maridesulfovibrio ferrireducens TaxID=246191 RepID=UPI001A20EDDF|nr:flavodoxin family protein [Maridesulfovibrio ferrireducens]MBI9111443.1 flavodoxin family protein [Maridesulfovibrio ferrireducens]
MYALAINGSPRKGGNTEILLNTALEPLTEAGWETELIRVGGKPMHGCMACYKCMENKDNKCVIKTDNFNELFEKIMRADALIFGSPTYFTDVSAELKGVLDRAGIVSIANDQVLRGKIGAAVVAVRRGGATHVYDTINHMFLMSQMIVPGSTYWNMGYGREKGDVKNDAEGLRNMNHLGMAINWLGKAIKPHLDSYPAPRD